MWLLLRHLFHVLLLLVFLLLDFLPAWPATYRAGIDIAFCNFIPPLLLLCCPGLVRTTIKTNEWFVYIKYGQWAIGIIVRKLCMIRSDGSARQFSHRFIDVYFLGFCFRPALGFDFESALFVAFHGLHAMLTLARSTFGLNDLLQSHIV